MELPENAWKAMAHGHPDNLQTILKMISAVDRIVIELLDLSSTASRLLGSWQNVLRVLSLRL